jgi:hypothetical protein
MRTGPVVKSLAQKLLDVTPAFADRQVANMIASRAIEFGAPYRFAINHDIRPPGMKACPLSHYDWALKDAVGIDTPVTPIAFRWLTSALLRGYTISRVDHNHRDLVPGFSSSIAIVRRRAENHQRPKVDNDDDIPF